MENFNIENAKTRFFESKEHYLNFRQAWKDFHNNRNHMKAFVWTDQHGKKHDCEVPLLTSSNYMLYNLLREYDITYGFTPLTTGKDHLKWMACHDAALGIFRTAKRLEDVNGDWEYSRDSARKDIDALLLPFGGHVSHETLREIGEIININVFNNQNFPQFDIQEWKDFTKEDKAKSKMTIAERIQSWKAA